MKHIKEFSRFAHVYRDYNMIQKEVAQDLLAQLSVEASKIVDLGCGSGTLYHAISWPIETFLGIDLSQEMLAHHPQNKPIALRCQSFDDKNLFEALKEEDFDLLLSSSSLQWSKDLKVLFERIQSLDKPFALSLFTSATFKTLHETAGTKSPLYSKELIQEYVKSVLDAQVTFKTYELSFDDTKSLFRYLKQSGVSSNDVQLSYKETKELMKAYPLSYLEFEVAFISKMPA